MRRSRHSENRVVTLTETRLDHTGVVMWTGNRRDWLGTMGAATAGVFAAGAWNAIGSAANTAFAQTPPGQRPKRLDDVRVLMPRDRVPLSFIIDDSTCLVNMGHFALPQFAEAWPGRAVYGKPWKTWPREIPDAFVREFGEWCHDNGVKGKYSIVPNPACVGWLDRELPGWSRTELQASLKLVRDLMVPDWDIHPEMITHTRVIDLKTGRPFAEINAGTMENSYPQQKKSVDELAAYLAYALKILKNCDLPCEGVTTPGGFGNLVKPELSLAVQQAVRDVYAVEIPHFFKYVVGGTTSTEPTVEHVSGLGTDGLNLTVNVPAGTGDWFGSWEGDVTPQPDKYATADASAGRMVEMIERKQPALMLCHWPGMYCNGTKIGFRDFQRVVTSLNKKYADVTQWMKLSEIARYWAVKELATISRNGDRVVIETPFACPQFTLSLPSAWGQPSQHRHGDDGSPITNIRRKVQLSTGTACQVGQTTTVCVDLKRGRNDIVLAAN